MSTEWFSGTITQEQALINKWLTDAVLGERASLCHLFQIVPLLSHWSRIWEYAWVIQNGNFQSGMRVLDAGGGASPLSLYLSSIGCQVTNVDLEGRGFAVMGNFAPAVNWLEGDIRNMAFSDGHFDRVISISVLEHVENPLQAVRELHRVCQDKLIITMDVTTTSRWNHNVDEKIAKKILEKLGLEWTEPHGAAAMRFQEHDREGKPEEGSTVSRVLGLAV